MPILTGTPPTAAPATVTPTVLRLPSAAHWTWLTPDGKVRDLSAGLTYLRPGGVAGHLAAPRKAYESNPPGMGGGLYRGVKFEPRDIALGLLTNAADTLVWKDEARQLVADFDTSTAAGVLQVQHADSDTRMLSCRYVAGLEAPSEGDLGVVTVGTWAVQLRAYDPWWYGPAVSRTFTVSEASNFWPASGGPPFTIMPSELVGSGTVVVNPGDVEAFPVWTVTGPCDSVTFASGDSSFTVDFSLNDGERLVVDCDPRVGPLSRVVDGSGSNLWGVATGDYPDLWALPVGESEVVVDVSGASSDTEVSLVFNPRFRTA